MEDILAQVPDAAPEQEAADPLAALVDADTSRPLPMNDSAVSRTALMASVGDVDISQTSDQTLMSEILETKSLYEDMFKAVGDNDYRRKKALEDKSAQVKDFIAYSREGGEESQGALPAASIALRQTDEERESYALEKSAATKMQALALRDPAQANAMEELPVSVLTHMADDQTRSMMIQKVVDELTQESKDRNGARKVVDFVVDNIVFPLDGGTSATGNVSERGFGGKVKDILFPSKAQEREARELSKIPLKDLPKALESIKGMIQRNSSAIGYTNKEEARRIFTELLDTPSAGVKNGAAIAELLMVIPVAKTAQATKALARSGARTQAVGLQSSALRTAIDEGVEVAAKKHGMEVEEILDNSLPTIMKTSPATDADVVPLVSDAQEAIDNGKKAIEDLGGLLSSNRLAPEQASAAFEQSVKDLKAASKGRTLKDVNEVKIDLPDGSSVSRVEGLVGRKKGGGFSTEARAVEVGERYGLAGEALQDASGQWFYKASLPTKETGFYTRDLDINASTPFSRYLRGSSQQSDTRLDQAAQLGGQKKQKIVTDLGRIWRKNNAKLTGGQRNNLNQVLAKATDNGEWHSPTAFKEDYFRLTGKEPSIRELDSYYDYKHVLDLEYTLRNSQLYKEKILQGFETVQARGAGLEAVRGNAKVQRQLGDIPADRAFNVTDGVHYNSSGKVSASEWATLKAQGYVKVAFEQAQEISEGVFVKTLVGRAEDFGVKTLDEVQLPYKGGPHRAYADRYFVKQGKTHKQADTGKDYLSSPTTVRAMSDKIKGAEWAETMNLAMKAFNDGGSLQAIDKIFGGRPEYPTPQEFLDSVGKKELDPNHPFEVVFDRELPSIYREGAWEGARFFDEAAENSLESMGRAQGRMYYSSRGEGLKGFDGELAPTLDPGQTLAQASRNISRIGGLGDYKIEAAQTLIENFSRHFSKDTPGLGSPQAILRQAKLVDGTDPRIVAQFETQRAIVNRVMGQPTAFDNAMGRWSRVVDEKMQEVGLGRVSRYALEKNPMNSFRSFAFHTKLGLFNVAQFPLQASTSVQAALLSPSYAKINPLQAYGAGILAKFAADGAAGGKAAKLLENKSVWQGAGFKSQKDAQDMVDALRASGWMDVNGSHLLHNADSTASFGRAKMTSGAGDLLDKSAFMFNEAEKWNRGVAFTIAWREVMEQTGKQIDRTDPEAMRQVMKKASTYSFEMTSESRSAWQKGLASVPTQFWSYPARMVEMMTGKNLSGSQKAKLIATQTALYGTAGVPLAGFVLDKTAKQDGQTFEAGSIPWMLERGSFDSMVHAVNGADVAIGSRIGTGDFAENLFLDLMNKSPYGDTSVLGFVGGVSGQTAKDAYTSVKDVLKYSLAMEGNLYENKLTNRAVQDVASNISTANNLMKSYYAFKYGELRSRKGTLIDTEVPDANAFAMLIGLQPGWMHDVQHRKKWTSDRKELTDQVSKEINRLTSEMSQRPAEYDNFLMTLQQLQQMTDPDIWDSASKQAARFGGQKALAKSFNERYVKEKSRFDMSERIKKKQKEENQ